ncbi:MAG: hypothetical protein Q9224_005017 [Gallowayella concinna]
MLREIVDSILHQIPQLIHHAVTVYKDLVRAQRTRAPNWHLEALTSLVNRIITQREKRIRLLLFVDALDEHEGDNELLVRLLEGWSQTVDGYHVALKICLASRSWPIFTDHFGRCPNFSIRHHTQEDIRLYAESSLSSSLPGPPQLLEPECLVYLTEQITTKAQGVFIWVRLVVDQLVKSIRDGTPYKTLRRMIAETPEELQDLYDNTLCRIDPGYANETYAMFQLVLCSIEPLPLDTVVKATEMSLERYLNNNNNQIANAFEKVSDNLSTEGLLRWLISRGGGLLEAYPADAHVDHLGESGTSHLYVQFLHQTTKEYIQSPRAYDLMKRVAPQVTNKNGFYFLTLSSQSCSAWVAPIKVHMLHYAKLVEVDNQIDARLEILIFPAQGPEDDHCGFDWWLDKQNVLMTLCDQWEEPIRPLPIYIRLVFIVAANLISMLDEDHMSRAELDTIRDPRNYGPCLLQVAIGGPDIVPAKLQDRVAMVVKLLSIGYPPHRWTPARMPGNNLIVTELKSLKMTAIEFLLWKCGDVPGSDETRVSILKALLKRGISDSDGDVSAMSEANVFHHCARFEGAAMIRALFEHGLVPSLPDEYGWLPVDYAVLRGDHAVLAAFNEFGTQPVNTLILERFRKDGSAIYGLLPSTTILSAIGHPGLAILLARYRGLGKSGTGLSLTQRRRVSTPVGHKYQQIKLTQPSFLRT